MLKRIKTGISYREMILDRAVDDDGRTVEVSFSSETPVPRFYGHEILDHSRKSVNLGRLKDGANVLFNHDPDRIIGVVEKAHVDRSDRRGRAVLRFGKSGEAAERFDQVAERILTKVSVGYAVHRMVRETTDDEAPDVFRVTDWEPYEISMVSLPADATVGVGRSATRLDDLEFETVVEERQMTPEEIEAKRVADAAAAAAAAAPVIAPAALVVEPVRAAPIPAAAPAVIESAASAEKRVAERNANIMVLARKHGLEALGYEHVERNASVAEFKDAVIETLLANGGQRPVVGERADIGLTPNEAKRYSLLNVMNVLCEPNNKAMQERAAFELECSRAVADGEGVTSPQGVFLTDSPTAFGYDWSAARGFEVAGAKVPAEVLRQAIQFAPYKRDLTAGTATDGAELVATNLLAGSFIDVLRNALVVAQMGAVMLRDLTGDVEIPRKTSGSAGAWIATENTDAAESEAQFDQVALTPRTVGAFTEISRNLRLQSSLDVESLVRADLMAGMATTIDLAALYGSGASGQPTGVVNQTGINTPTAFAGVNPTYAEVVAMETAVSTDNALAGRLGYIAKSVMRGALKTTLKDSGVAGHIWPESGNVLNGYPAAVTEQLTDGDLFFGNWADLLIGMWAGLDLLLDPYSGSLAGRHRLVAHQSVDVAVRHPVSFAFNNDT